MSRPQDPSSQCQHISPRGQRCRMLRASLRESLCAHHLQQAAAAQPDPEVLAAELLDSTGTLHTADEVNTLLGNLVQQFVRKRIDRKDAIALAYMSQLLLISLPALERQHKAEAKAQSDRDFEKFCRAIQQRRANQASRSAAKASSPSDKSPEPNASAAVQQN